MRYGPWSASCSYLGMGPCAPLPLNIATVFDDGSTSDVVKCGISWYLFFHFFHEWCKTLSTGNVSSRAIFLTERLSSLVLSFILGEFLAAVILKASWMTLWGVDLCVARLVPIERAKALLLLASSHLLMTFQVRPFSNSLETCLVAAALVVLNSMLSDQSCSSTAKRVSVVLLIDLAALIRHRRHS
jgi:hypothetical protein